MQTAESLLGGLSAATFLRRHWQKQPLLVRAALPGFRSPLTPQELAGLACDEAVESRLVLEQAGDRPWQSRSGPFRTADFIGLPAGGWTLLVQEVDRLVPAVGALLELFRFLPNWRIDDVMVSYAPHGGGVGAHVDSYDVFLLQGLGRRRWEIGDRPVPESEERHLDLDLRVLDGFTADREWILDPGDLLYLPPRLAHRGTAVGDCMTFSIGFHAPSHREIVAAFAGDAVERLDPAARYADPELWPSDRPGRIEPATLHAIGELIAGLAAPETLARWFGRYVTEPRRESREAAPERRWSAARLARTLARGSRLERSAPYRFAYVERDDGSALLFVGGVDYALDPEVAFAAPLLTGCERLDGVAVAPLLAHEQLAGLLVTLVHEGFLVVEG